MNYIDRLIEDCFIAKNPKLLREFIMQELEDLSGIKHAVYKIEQVTGNIENTFKDFKNYKKTSERKCPRANSASKVMYVGSSTTNLKKRISEHIGNGYPYTYALNLKHWFKDKYKITIFEYDVSKNVLQIIEDNLASDLKPAFGKRGSNI